MEKWNVLMAVTSFLDALHVRKYTTDIVENLSTAGMHGKLTLLIDHMSH